MLDDQEKAEIERLEYRVELALAYARRGKKLLTLVPEATTGLPVSVTSTDPNNPNVVLTIPGVKLTAGQLLVLDESLQYLATSASGGSGQLAATVGTVIALTGNPDYDEVRDTMLKATKGEGLLPSYRSVSRRTYVTVGAGLGDIAPGTYDVTLGAYLFDLFVGTTVQASQGILIGELYAAP
jgi:hypothetical protein